MPTRLRDDVREAFEREQRALGEVGDARHRIMRNALARSEAPAMRGLQWVAGIAAVLIAGGVIATFVIARDGIHSGPVPAATQSPKVQASPTPLQQALSVPASMPVIIYHDPAVFDQLDGVTWDGKTSGRIGQYAALGGAANPQGTYYVGEHHILNRAGEIVQDYSPADYAVYWADDGTQFCDVIRTQPRDVTGPGLLQVRAPGQAPRNVVQVGTVGAANLNAGGPVVVACSPVSDRAVVYQAAGQGVGVQEFWVIQLSTGHTLWHGGSGSWIVASHDGQYVALSPAPGSPTQIYGPDGSVAGTHPETVFEFSWDGRLAVVAGNFGAEPRVIDWRTGQTVWTCPNNTYKYWQAFPEPGGSHLAIGVTDPLYKNTNGFQPVDLFVVGADGVVSFEEKDVTLFQQN